MKPGRGAPRERRVLTDVPPWKAVRRWHPRGAVRTAQGAGSVPGSERALHDVTDRATFAADAAPGRRVFTSCTSTRSQCRNFGRSGGRP